MAFSPYSFEMIFALLAKIIVFHIQIAIVQVGVLGLEWSIYDFFSNFYTCQSLVLNFINISPYELSE